MYEIICGEFNDHSELKILEIGAGNFQTGQETRSGTVFYYGQEFPNGTAATISTYTLRITKA